ncbi:hypothetical protein HDV04_000708 [Boothiomyces sp. JEL0838]|nr:hypothetical protein HDV04_000708 [Boothiomyces sp. JEL0838]
MKDLLPSDLYNEIDKLDDNLAKSLPNPPTFRQPVKPKAKKTDERDNRKKSLYKTELCRSREETGVCPYGPKCQFAHSEAELRVLDRHPKYKSEQCKTFWEKGTCPYGKRCCFIHTSKDDVKKPLMIKTERQRTVSEGFEYDTSSPVEIKSARPFKEMRSIPSFDYAESAGVYRKYDYPFEDEDDYGSFKSQDISNSLRNYDAFEHARSISDYGSLKKPFSIDPKPSFESFRNSYKEPMFGSKSFQDPISMRSFQDPIGMRQDAFSMRTYQDPLPSPSAFTKFQEPIFPESPVKSSKSFTQPSALHKSFEDLSLSSPSSYETLADKKIHSSASVSDLGNSLSKMRVTVDRSLSRSRRGFPDVFNSQETLFSPVTPVTGKFDLLSPPSSPKYLNQ